MSRVYASHPSDRVAAAGAAETDADRLTGRYEEILDVIEGRYGKTGGYGAMQALCSLAIARVELLERELELARHVRREPAPAARRVVPARVRDERRARARLYPRSGDVIQLPVGDRS